MKMLAAARSLMSSLLMVAMVLGIQACGGGGGGGGGLAAPSITDASAQSYTEATTISALNFSNGGGGSLTSCTASPTLPDGLSIAVSSNSNTCEISGTATNIQSASDYTVTATNATGSDTATVSIAISKVNAEGYFTGTADVKEDGNNAVDFAVTDLQVMISGTRIMMMSDAQALLYDGTFTTSGNTLTSTVTIYHNGNKVGATAELSATVTEGSQITGTLTGTDLGNGTFESTYGLLSNTDSNLSQVTQPPSMRDPFWFLEPKNTFEFGITADGDLTESTVPDDTTFDGCNIMAGSKFETIANSSLFAVTLVFGTCVNASVEGTYTGFSQSLTTTSLSLSISNGTNALAYNFKDNS